MVKHRKRAPGGGRKPKGEFDRLSATVTMRMPEDLRERLVRAADNNDRSITQEVLRRLHDSFTRDRSKERDPAMRALCFLIAETAHQVAGPPVTNKDGTEAPMFNWRSNPFFFRAFKLAVGQVLDALQPPGDANDGPRVQLKLFPNVETATQEEGDSLAAWFMRSFESPQARADYAARHVLGTLTMVSEQSIEERTAEARRLGRIGIASFLREHYGMIDAAKDLQIPKSKS
jgi:hypothetical protein